MKSNRQEMKHFLYLLIDKHYKAGAIQTYNNAETKGAMA